MIIISRISFPRFSCLSPFFVFLTSSIYLFFPFLNSLPFAILLPIKQRVLHRILPRKIRKTRWKLYDSRYFLFGIKFVRNPKRQVFQFFSFFCGRLSFFIFLRSCAVSAEHFRVRKYKFTIYSSYICTKKMWICWANRITLSSILNPFYVVCWFIFPFVVRF